MSRIRPCAAALVVAILALAHLAPAAGEGLNLDGRLAPELTFPTGTNGIAPGTTLSSFRGKVVWLKFILRDCPHCRATLPRFQEIHDRWGGSGLVTIAVVHQYGPAQMTAFLAQNGYTFPVGTDPDGSLAARYGVKRRPADYVIGIDGRVVSSNADAPDTVLRTELGKYRLARLGAVPASLASVRDAVWNWDYGTALRTTEAAASAPDAPADVRAVDQRVHEQAREELDARLALARVYEARRDLADARDIYDRVAAHFRGTSLEADAARARNDFLARTGGR